ncbi:C4b-binding protein alpha chain-like [Platysternon megacephalum]|uniref:C4b-binding protein alpha chain-like n=1 Tax=Platysternon megacephalum TaxID=55544 RepID=A0A4D9E0X3_9SAUR|nr:C4b-binding protein alpha chain-like [Platysternon megacephalum]
MALKSPGPNTGTVIAIGVVIGLLVAGGIVAIVTYKAYFGKKKKKQSTSNVCEMVPESREFTECGVPLEKLITLLEVQKLYLEIEKLKQELKSQ